MINILHDLLQSVWDAETYELILRDFVYWTEAPFLIEIKKNCETQNTHYWDKRIWFLVTDILQYGR